MKTETIYRDNIFYLKMIFTLAKTLPGQIKKNKVFPSQKPPQFQAAKVNFAGCKTNQHNSALLYLR